MLRALCLLAAATATATVAAPATAAPADADDCTLSTEAIAPILDAAKVQQRKSERDRKLRRLKESALFAGRQVVWDVGGCAHFGFTLSITLRADETPPHDRAEALRMARTLFAQIPVSKKGRSNRDIVVNTLTTGTPTPAPAPAAGGDGDEYPLVCGDATCGLRVTGKTLSFFYDFPL